MEGNPFYFYTSSNLVELTGEKADNLEELVALLKRCTGSAIFYHVFQSFRDRQGKTPFFFCQSISIVMPTHYIAWNLEDFYQVIGKIGIRSIHYHLIEARLRLGIHTNDFSNWFRNSLGMERPAQRIEGIDIYLHSLEEIRKKILQYGEEEMK